MQEWRFDDQYRCTNVEGSYILKFRISDVASDGVHNRI